MIAKLRGTVWSCDFNRVVLNVHDVGYELQISTATYERLSGETAPVELFVHTQVREDAITLFGFASEAEKALFELLLTVSGVGGKLALSVLSGLPVETVCRAVADKNIAVLSKISGIGKRTAERISVELHDKVAGIAALNGTGLIPGAVKIPSGIASTAVNDAVLALEQLGFKRDTALASLHSIAADLPEDELTPENLLRLGLQALNR